MNAEPLPGGSERPDAPTVCANCGRSVLRVDGVDGVRGRHWWCWRCERGGQIGDDELLPVVPDSARIRADERAKVEAAMVERICAWLAGRTTWEGKPDRIPVRYAEVIRDAYEAGEFTTSESESE